MSAGGRGDGATTDYFFPLDRAFTGVTAHTTVEHRAKRNIPTPWMIEAFDKCNWPALNADRERDVRENFPEETAMLVATTVLPEGLAHGRLEEDDVLVKVNGELVTEFASL